MSLPSLAQVDFLPQMQDLMRSVGAGDALDPALPRLSVELDAHGLVAYPQEMRACCAAVVQARGFAGLRRLDQEPRALALLHTLALAYVKLGSHFAESGLESPGARYLREAMAPTAKVLGLRLYVTDEADAQAAALLRGQGAYLLAAQPSKAA